MFVHILNRSLFMQIVNVLSAVYDKVYHNLERSIEKINLGKLDTSFLEKRYLEENNKDGWVQVKLPRHYLYPDALLTYNEDGITIKGKYENQLRIVIPRHTFMNTSWDRFEAMFTLYQQLDYLFYFDPATISFGVSTITQFSKVGGIDWVEFHEFNLSFEEAQTSIRLRYEGFEKYSDALLDWFENNPEATLKEKILKQLDFLLLYSNWTIGFYGKTTTDVYYHPVVSDQVNANGTLDILVKYNVNERYTTTYSRQWSMYLEEYLSNAKTPCGMLDFVTAIYKQNEQLTDVLKDQIMNIESDYLNGVLELQKQVTDYVASHEVSSGQEITIYKNHLTGDTLYGSD